jgi:hypothetical protein
MKKALSVLAVLLATMGLPALCSGDEPPKRDREPRKVSDLMRKKLENSQKVLEGLAINDFKMIGRHAEELIDISKQAEWRVLKTPQYELNSNEFRRIAERLVNNAKDRNLDAAALSYVELTLTCVRCHKHVREERMTRLDRESVPEGGLPAPNELRGLGREP